MSSKRGAEKNGSLIFFSLEEKQEKGVIEWFVECEDCTEQKKNNITGFFLTDIKDEQRK